MNIYKDNKNMAGHLPDRIKRGEVYNKPFYTIILNSINAYQSPSGVNQNNDKVYNINWEAIMPDCPYEVHFTFMAENNQTLLTTIPMVYCDFGNTNVYQPASAGGRTIAGTTGYMGILRGFGVGGQFSFFSEDETNMPIYLNSRPRNNVFTIRILNNDGTPFFSPTGGNIGSYIMTINFYPSSEQLHN